jgi:hypothetical protein
MASHWAITTVSPIIAAMPVRVGIIKVGEEKWIIKSYMKGNVARIG